MQDFVSYKDFGAVGDGKTNDFFAIKAAHEFANKNGLPVRAGKAGMTFLIRETEIDGVADSIKIETDTNWCGATIVIDDTDVSWCEGTKKQFCTPIFEIVSKIPNVEIEKKYLDKINENGGINREKTKKLELGIDFPAMLLIYNEDKIHFIRYGGNEDSGTAQRELALVDADGNLDPSTPLLYDFEKVTRITAVRCDIPELTVENATVISMASQVNLIDQYHSISRGIRIRRSNTTVKHVEHKIINEILKGELKDGVPFIGHSYGAILRAHECHNVLFEDCVFQARAYYLQGTYDFSAGMANKITLHRCTQSNFFGHYDPTRFRNLVGRRRL